MKLSTALTLLVVATIAIVASASSSDVDLDGLIDLSSLIDLPPQRVQDWTPLHVARWINITIGYPEYADIAIKHLMDGPTLLVVDPAEAFAPISHPIHLAKFRAHLALLQHQCVCDGASALGGFNGVAGRVTDFWSFYKANKMAVFRIAPLLEFSPRVGLAYLFFFEGELYKQLMGVAPLSQDGALANAAVTASGIKSANGTTSDATNTTTKDGADGEGDKKKDSNDNSDVEPAFDASESLPGVPLWATILFIICSAAAPNAVIVFNILRVWTCNWIILSPVVSMFLLSQVLEVMGVIGIMSAPISMKEKVLGVLWSKFMLIPVATYVLSFVLPFVVQEVLVYVYILFCVVVSTSSVIGFLAAFFGKAGPEGEPKQE